MTIELSFERDTAYLVFSSVRNITFVQNSFIQVNGRSTISLGRKPSVLEAAGPCKLIFENLDCWGKE
jgi:hypothetical protein